MPELSARRAVDGLIAAQLAIWTLVPALLAISLPLDVVSDMLAWGHEWQLGYYKHPPLPAWLAEISFTTFGNLGPFLLSQIFIAATYVFVFALGRAMMDETKAAIGTLLLAGIFYFSLSSPEFNNNVAQMPLWAAAVFAFYKALQTRQARWWIALGIAAGLGMLAKYSTATLLAAMLFWLLYDRSARSALLSPATYLAPLVALIVFAPHLYWLVQNHFPTLHYAQARAGHAAGVMARLRAVLHFVLAQLLDLAPALLVWGAMLYFGRARQRDDEDGTTLRFLFVLGLGPVLLTIVMSLASGFGVRDMWAAPMWNLIGLLLVQSVRLERPDMALRRVVQCTLALLVILPLVFVFTNFIGPQMRGRPARMAWPDRAMAARLSADFQAQTGRPVDIVAGDSWIAGLIALRTSPRASVYTDADPAHAPWVTPQRIAQSGLLTVWRAKGDGAPPPELAAIPGMRAMGVECFAWPKAHRAASLRIGWGIVRPRGNLAAAAPPIPGAPCKSGKADDGE
jgi:4-amino-4-deoxy-L-arabinose transferase-like glycosyltransferase